MVSSGSMESVGSGQIALLILTAVIASAISVYAAWASKGKGRFLCDDCRFNNDADCVKEERPRAVSCTSYRAVEELSTVQSSSESTDS